MGVKNFLLAAAFSCIFISKSSAGCIFGFWNNEYRCTLNNVVSRLGSDFVDLSGDHIEGRTNADVLQVHNAPSSTIEEIPSIIFETFTNLQSVHTSPNLLRLNLDNCGNNLQELWLIGNPLIFELTAGSLRGCQSLRWLSLTRSSIQSINDNAFDNTPNLSFLALNNNFLSTIRSGWLRGLTGLENLQLEDNQITSIQSGAFVGSGVTEIHLRNNRLTRIESETFTNMPNLDYLDVSNNLIANIDAGAFGNLPQLWKVDFTGNQLTTLHANVFAPLPSISWLRFDSNRINAVAREFFDATRLGRRFSFIGNVCVNQEFIVASNIENDVFPGMQTCFNNYV